MSTSATAVDNVSSLASAHFQARRHQRRREIGWYRISIVSAESARQRRERHVRSWQRSDRRGAHVAAPPHRTRISRCSASTTSKLNTPSHTTPKYVFARATQDVNLAWDRASRSAGLQQIVDNVKQNGYPNATVTGKDSIDFGDGAGPVDVLTGDGTWWWGPKN